MKAWRDHRHPPLQPQGIERGIDRTPGNAAPGHADMREPRVTLRGDLTVQQRMILAHQTNEVGGKQVLNLHFRGQRPGVADAQIDPPFAQRLIIAIAFRDETQFAVRRLPVKGVEQLAAVDADKEVVGPNTETPPQRTQLHRIGRTKQQTGLFHHAANLFAQLQCLGGRYQATAGAHQDRIANGLANARQRPAHGRRAEVHPPRRAHHTALVEQSIEGDQQVHVWELHGEHSCLIWTDSDAMLANKLPNHVLAAPTSSRACSRKRWNRHHIHSR
ncbi:hypothetical protein D3C80_958210 [compost metagenome]